MSTLSLAISDLFTTLNEGRGIEAVEGDLFEIIDMLREDPKLKSQFLEMAEQTFKKRWPYALGENSVPSELLELATHELRWPEFEILANKRIQDIFGGDELLAISDVSYGIKQAYADDWEDRQFFHRYAA
jgi:hypothetical protein